MHENVRVRVAAYLSPQQAQCVGAQVVAPALPGQASELQPSAQVLPIVHPFHTQQRCCLAVVVFVVRDVLVVVLFSGRVVLGVVIVAGVVHIVGSDEYGAICAIGRPVGR